MADTTPSSDTVSAAVPQSAPNSDLAALMSRMAQMERTIDSLRAQLQAFMGTAQHTLGQLAQTGESMAVMDRDVQTLRAASAFQNNFVPDDTDDVIPGVTRQTPSETSGTPPTLIEDWQITNLGVTPALQLAFQGFAVKHVQGLVYAMRALSTADGASEDGWITVPDVWLLPSGTTSAPVGSVQVPVWNTTTESWEAITLAASDILTLLGWGGPAAGLLLIGNGAGHAPTFQDIGVALATLVGSATGGGLLTLVEVPNVGLQAQWVALQALTPGAGLVGSPFNGSAAQTWAVNLGTGANQAAYGNHTHDWLAGIAAELAAKSETSGILVYSNSAGVMTNASLFADQVMDGTPAGNPGRVLYFMSNAPAGENLGQVGDLDFLLGSFAPVNAGVTKAAGLILRLTYASGQYGAMWDQETTITPGTVLGQILFWNTAPPAGWTPSTLAEALGMYLGTQSGVSMASGLMLVSNGSSGNWGANWDSLARQLGVNIPVSGTAAAGMLLTLAGSGPFTAQWAALAALTPGTGLVGTPFNGSAAQTWAVNLGTGANQAAYGNHTHDWLAGIAAELTSKSTASGIMIYTVGAQNGVVSTLSTLLPDVITTGVVGNGGRVISFGPNATDVGALSDLQTLLGTYAPVASGVTKAAGLILKLTCVSGQYGAMWDQETAVPIGTALGQILIWNTVVPAGWTPSTLAAALGMYLGTQSGVSMASGLMLVSNGSSGNWGANWDSLARQLGVNIPVSGTAAAGMLLALAGSAPNFTAQWAAAPAAAAQNPGTAVSPVGVNGVSVETALTDSWVAGGANGLSLWVETRQRYYAAGSKTWWAYARQFIFDATGRLYSVSAETRYAVEIPTAS